MLFRRLGNRMFGLFYFEMIVFSMDMDGFVGIFCCFWIYFRVGEASPRTGEWVRGSRSDSCSGYRRLKREAFVGRRRSVFRFGYVDFIF